MADRIIVTNGGGGVLTIFWALVLFFIVLPLVAVIGCLACTGAVVHESVKHFPDFPDPPVTAPARPEEPIIQRSPVTVPEPIVKHPEQPPPAAADQPFETEFPVPDELLPRAEQAAVQPAQELRDWTSADGSYELAAEFVSLGSGEVRLRKAGGTIIVVPMDSLSDEDQQFIRSRGRRSH